MKSVFVNVRVKVKSDPSDRTTLMADVAEQVAVDADEGELEMEVEEDDFEEEDV